MRQSCVLIAALFVLAAALAAQQRVDPRWNYHRVIAVLPMQGSGTAADPLRPKHAPAPGVLSRAGIVAFTFEFSDDGQLAIAEFVAVDRPRLAEVLADTAPGVLVFEKGVVPKATIEAAIKPFRKDFSLDTFGVPVQ